jgi:hypothetical protein
MNKLAGADVRRLLDLFLLKARLKVRLFAAIGDHRPCLHLLLRGHWLQHDSHKAIHRLSQL